MRDRWHTYFAHLVEQVASNSVCLSRKVGAIIVRDKRIIATGYNGLPSGFNHCSVCYGGERESGHGLHHLPCQHAEANALLQCSRFGVPVDGAVMYVSIMPCNDCLKHIISAGLKHVYCLELYSLDERGEELRAYMLNEAHRATGFRMTLLPGHIRAA